MLYGLDLFSGIGGFSLALEPWVRTVTYCEADKHAQAVLLSRMAEGSIDLAPICSDIRELSKDAVDIPIDIIFGGFPCQDISVAGKGEGLDGERSGLFYEIMRLAKEIQPTFLFLENVPAIRTRGLDRVIEELTQAGYDCRWTMLSAAEVGAPHKRERWFLLAKSASERLQGQLWQPGVTNESDREAQGERREQANTLVRRGNVSPTQQVAHTDSTRLEVRQCESSDDGTQQQSTIRSRWWESEPDVGRVVNGVPQRVDRLKRLGNAVVPAQARQAFKILMGVKRG